MLVPFAIVHGLLGIVIGDTIKSGKSKLYTFMASGLTLLSITIVMYIATVLFFKINVVEEMLNSLSTVKEQVTSIMTNYGELPVDFEKQLDEYDDPLRGSNSFDVHYIGICHCFYYCFTKRHDREKTWL